MMSIDVGNTTLEPQLSSQNSLNNKKSLNVSKTQMNLETYRPQEKSFKAINVKTIRFPMIKST